MAQGTIYLFVKTKEELFFRALLKAMNRPQPVEDHVEVDLNQIALEFQATEVSPSLTKFLQTPGLVPPTLSVILGEYWDAITRGARAVKLIERCAPDLPDLAHYFYLKVRSTVVSNIAQYLSAGAEAGICRKVIDEKMSARFIVETIAWFAMHRLGDPDGRYFDPAECRATVLDNLIHTFCTFRSKEP